MTSLLSNLVNNISQGIHKMKCKCRHDDLIKYKCLCCNKNYQQKFDEKLKERFFNTYNFSNYDKNRFILLLQKGV